MRFTTSKTSYTKHIKLVDPCGRKISRKINADEKGLYVNFEGKKARLVKYIDTCAASGFASIDVTRKIDA
jgi:hypothetical protein